MSQHRIEEEIEEIAKGEFEREPVPTSKLNGFILSPFGVIIVFEHFFSKKVGIVKNYAQKTGISLNKAVFLAWAISFGLFYFISPQFNVFLSFVTFPAWLLCGVLFLVFSKRIQKNGSNK